jgi:hypothetical protein
VLLWTPTMLDRASMLEQAWARQLGGGPARLSQWTARVKEGELPQFIFNATSMETGDRVLVGAVRIPEREGRRPAGVIHFADLYCVAEVECGRDIAVATAARLSATFPFVSPVARARRVDTSGRLVDGVERSSDHFADGGYADNFGVATAIDWLGAVLPAIRHRVRTIVVVRIQLESDASVRHVPAMFNGALGPLVTLYQAREATQSARNTAALGLLAAQLGVAPCLVQVEFVPGQSSSRPLSWHLTDADRADIRGWGSVHRRAVEQVRRWLNDTPGGCLAPRTAY